MGAIVLAGALLLLAAAAGAQTGLFDQSGRLGPLSGRSGAGPSNDKDLGLSLTSTLPGSVLAESSPSGKLITINADTIIRGSLTFASLQTSSNASIGGDLTTEGDSNLGGQLTVAGPTVLQDSLRVVGATTLSTLAVRGQVRLTGSGTDILVLQPAVNPANPVRLLTVKNAAGTSTYAYIDSSGASSFTAGTFNGTLGVTGATTLSSTLAVSGASTLTGNVSAGGSLTVAGSSALSGATSLGSSLSVSGSTTLSSATSIAGPLTVSAAGAASTPAALFAGSWYTGGSGTTTKPQLLIEPTGTTSTAWSTGGTGLGVNAASGFSGNLIDAQVAGSSKFMVDASGNVTITGTLTGGGSGALGYWSRSGTTLSPTNNGDAVTTSGNISTTGSGTITSAGLLTASVGLVIMSGNVGIGTTTPTSNLQIASSASALPVLTLTNAISAAASGGQYSLERARGTLNSPTALIDGDRIGIFKARGYSTFFGTYADSAFLKFEADGNEGSQRIPGRIVFSVSDGTAGPADKVTIKSSGNVGIGTTSPGATLHVTNNSSSVGQLRLQQAATGGKTWELQSWTDASLYVNNQAGQEVLRLTDSRNVLVMGGSLGIGTTSPGSLLHLKSSGYPTVNIESTTANGGVLQLTSLTNNWQLYNQTGDLRFYSSTAPAGDRIAFTSAGNVGIGTTAPATALDVAGSGTFSTAVIVGSSPAQSGIIRIPYNNMITGRNQQNSTNIALIGVGSGDTGNKVTIGQSGTGTSVLGSLDTAGTFTFSNSSTLNSTDVGIVREASGATLKFNSTTTGQQQFSIGGTVMVTIANSGNVGIGTTAPGSKLSVNGGISIGSYATNAAPSNGLIVSGNVGIGTTAPGDQLHISGDSGSIRAGIRLQDTNASGNTWEIAPGAGSSGLGQFTIRDNTASDAIRLVIAKTTGNVGIGTTNPGQLLHVKRSTDGVVARFEDADGSCDVNPTSTALVCSSDARLKTDVTSLSGSLDKLTSLRGVTFRWLSQQDGTLHPGLIAQEVERVLPEVVSTDSKGYKAIAYTNLIPYLIEATKELNLKVSQVGTAAVLQPTSQPSTPPAAAADLAALASRVDQLSTQLAALQGAVLSASSSASLASRDASSSAQPAGLDLNSPAASSAAAAMTINHETWDTLNQQGLKIADATVSGTLRSLGETFLGSTLIAGDLTVDGTLSITGDSLSAMGTLYLQNGPLAKAVDLFDGKVTFSQNGSLTLHEGSLAVAKGTIGGNDTIRGRASLKAGATSVRVDRSWSSEPSSMTLTPTYNTRAWIEDLSPSGFTIKVDSAPSQAKDIHWLAIW